MRKLNKNGGFTLIEMLIVVAIIAILIAVSIPMINSALESARDATDQANERAAKASMLVISMGVAKDDEGNDYESANWYVYDANKGTMTDLEIANTTYEGVVAAAQGKNVPAYGQCAATHNEDTFAAQDGADTGDHVGDVLIICVAGDDGLNSSTVTKGEVYMEWISAKA